MAPPFFVFARFHRYLYGVFERDIIGATSSLATGRLSRCIRESEAGWLFYSPIGTAYHIFKEKAERIETAGLHQIERLEQFARKPAMPWFPAELISFTATCMMVAAIMIAIFHPLLAMIIRSTGMMLWQALVAHKLRRKGRGGVSEKIAKHHLRYNLFRLISMAAIILIVARYTIFFVMPLSDIRENFGWVDAALFGVFFWAAVPAFLVDNIHRRRKWLDQQDTP